MIEVRASWRAEQVHSSLAGQFRRQEREIRANLPNTGRDTPAGRWLQIRRIRVKYAHNFQTLTPGSPLPRGAVSQATASPADPPRPLLRARAVREPRRGAPARFRRPRIVARASTTVDLRSDSPSKGWPGRARGSIGARCAWRRSGPKARLSAPYPREIARRPGSRAGCVWFWRSSRWARTCGSRTSS